VGVVYVEMRAVYIDAHSVDAEVPVGVELHTVFGIRAVDFEERSARVVECEPDTVEQTVDLYVRKVEVAECVVGVAECAGDLFDAYVEEQPLDYYVQAVDTGRPVVIAGVWALDIAPEVAEFGEQVVGATAPAVEVQVDSAGRYMGAVARNVHLLGSPL
jgi:hypothetical protein